MSERAALDTTGFVDKVAQTYYETSGPMDLAHEKAPWETFKTDNPLHAEAYMRTARFAVMKAMPRLDLDPIRAEAWTEGAEVARRYRDDLDLAPLNPYARP